MSWLDWLVLAAYGLLMLGIGAYYARRNKSADDFLLGGRRMSPIAVGLSLFATLVSTLSYLGNPGEMIANGPMMSLQVVVHPLAFLIVGFGLIPLLMRQPVTSAYELLESRLGPSVRLAGAGVFLTLRFGWMATILYGTSDVLVGPLLGLDPSWTPVLCVVMGLLTAVYSSAGGIKAVVMTDAVQAITMLAGALITLALISVRMGGVAEWWPTAWASHWREPSWGFDPHAYMPFGMLLVSTLLWYVCTNGSDQMSIQRFLSTRDAAAARKTLAVAQFSDAIVATLMSLTGVAVLGYYLRHQPELVTPVALAEGGDKVFPRFIMHELPVGVTGLVLAAVLAAAFSSLSSGVNSACAVIERDFLSRLGADKSESASVARLRWLTWLVAIVAIGLSLLNLLVEGNLIKRCFTFINLFTAPLFVLFFLALFVRWANAVGAWLGLAASLATAVVVAFWVELGTLWTKLGFSTALAAELDLPRELSIVWIIPSALLAGVVVGTAASALVRLVAALVPQRKAAT